MLGHGYLKHQSLQGSLIQQSQLKPKGGRRNRPLLFTLTLTSLIDAFSILVIFLLTSASNTGQPLDFRGHMQLPLSQRSDELGVGTVIRIVDGRYYVNEKEVSVQQIPQLLYTIKKDSKATDMDSLIIQADRRVEYASLSPIILSASHAGYEKFKFAVLPVGGSTK